MNPANSLAVRFLVPFLGEGWGFGSYNSCLLFIHIAAMKRRQKCFFCLFFSQCAVVPTHPSARSWLFSKCFCPSPQMYSHCFNKILSRGGRAEGFFFPPPSSLHQAVKCSGQSRAGKKLHSTPRAYSPVLFFCFFSLTTPSSLSACVTVCQSPSSQFIPLTHISDVSQTKCDHHRAPAEGERD